MTGFEPRTSGIGSDRSTNWATTTAIFIINCMIIERRRRVTYILIKFYQSVVVVLS